MSYLQVPGPRLHHAPEGGPAAVSVLVVDDDDLKRYTLNRLLSPLGYHIVEADSGLAALRCLLVQDFAVILLDIRMPGMDGFETATLIRSRPRSRGTPIMLTTTSTRDEIVASGMFGDKATDLMFAPVNSNDMRAAVRVFGENFLVVQELARQARAAQVSAERWRLLTEAAPVGIFQMDRCQRYTHTNPRWSEITGVPAETALGQEWTMIVNAGQALPLIREPGTKGLREAELPHRIEVRSPGAGSKIVILNVKRVLDPDGEFAGWVGTLTDITTVGQNHAAPSPLPVEAVGSSFG